MTTPAVAFLSTAPKAARGRRPGAGPRTRSPRPGSASRGGRSSRSSRSLSILFGNVVALAQRDLKRMLAYSGIAQMGYVAIALATFTTDAFEGVLVFLAGYLVTNVAAFLSVAALSNGREGAEPARRPRGPRDGAGRSRPSVLTLSMLSLTGLPPTVGFIGKLLVFRAAVDAGLVTLALVGIVGSLVSVGYYLRVVYDLWMKEPSREVAARAGRRPVRGRLHPHRGGHARPRRLPAGAPRRRPGRGQSLPLTAVRVTPRHGRAWGGPPVTARPRRERLRGGDPPPLPPPPEPPRPRGGRASTRLLARSSRSDSG